MSFASLFWRRKVLLIARIVDHGLGDVLIHEDQQRQCEAEAHGGERC